METEPLDWLAVDDFDPRPPISVTVSGLLAAGTLWLTSPFAPSVGFGLACIVGLGLGALGSALASRQFHWVPPQPGQVGPQLLGGILMGVGAILAGGCNIGNGITGVSTLSLRALLALACMLIGMRLALIWVRRREA